MKELSVEKVMLDIAKKDVTLKKELFVNMKKSDKEQCDQLRALNETMLHLTKSINEGVRVLGQTNPAIMQNRQFVPAYPTHSVTEQTSYGPSMSDQCSTWSKCWSNPPDKWHEPVGKHIQFPLTGNYASTQIPSFFLLYRV
jgi:hypothetical protein